MRLFVQRSLHTISWLIIIVTLLVLLYYCYKAVTFHLGFGLCTGIWDMRERDLPMCGFRVPRTGGPGPEMFAGGPEPALPLSCVHSSCTRTLGPRPAPPGEEGVGSSLQGPSAPGGGRQPASPSGEKLGQKLFRVRRGQRHSTLPPRPLLELVGGSDFSLRPGKSHWLPIPHCAPLGPVCGAGGSWKWGQAGLE